MFLPGPALLHRDRFPTTRPRTPSLLLGQRAALSRDRLLGSAVTDMSLSLRLIPQAQPRFSLRQKGCPGKEDFAPCGLITLCSGVMLRLTAAASHRPNSNFPMNAVLSQRGCPSKMLSLYAGFSRHAANTRLSQAATAAHRTDYDFPATARLSQRISAWCKPHFAAASLARLWLFALSHQGRRAAGELVPLGPCFLGLMLAPWVHPARPD